jgi:hypothetical protein
MQVMLEARGLWTAIETGTAEREQDRQAMEALLCAVPPDMISTLGVKATAKEAWDTLKAIHVGSDRVRKAKAQSLHKQYEALQFKDGEGVDAFAMRLTGLVSALANLSDTIPEDKVVLKFLAAVPKKYSQMACSIETLLDLDKMTIEDLTGRLKVVEDRNDVDNSTGSGSQLLLTELEWLARSKRVQSGASNSNKQARGHGRSSDTRNSKYKPGGGGGNARNGSASKAAKDDKCRYCGKKGHWAHECRKRLRDEAEANLTQAEEDEDPGLLMA